MKDWIKPNRIVFKIGSLAWLNHFGLPMSLIVLSLIQFYFLLKDINVSKYETLLIMAIIIFLIGLISYYIQYRRLKFKNFELKGDLDNFKWEVKTMLTNNGWRIDYDNKLYLQATYMESNFNLDMLTLRFKSSEIQWNVIHHPYSHNAIAALFTLNRKGETMIKMIKASA